MGTTTPDELLKLWKLENITVEMAIGHILQNLVKMQRTHDTRNTKIYNLRADVDSLIIHTGMKPDAKGKKAN